MATIRETANTLFDVLDKFAAFCVAHAGYTRIPATAPNVIIEKGKVRYRFDATITKGTDGTNYPSFDPNTKMFRIYAGYVGGSVNYQRYVPVNINLFTEPFVGVNFVANKFDQALILEVGEKVYVHVVIGKIPASTKGGAAVDALEYVQAMTFLNCNRSVSVVGYMWDTEQTLATLPFGAGKTWDHFTAPTNDYLCSIIRTQDNNSGDDFKRTTGQYKDLGTQKFPDSVCMFEPLISGDPRVFTYKTPNVNTGRTVLSPIRLRMFNPALSYRFYYAGEVETVRYVDTRFIEPGAVLDGEWLVFPCFSRVQHPSRQYPHVTLGIAYNIRDF